MHKKIVSLVTVSLAVFLLLSCSLPPQQPVMRTDLMSTRIYNKYIIDESPEELLYALNTRGEIIIEGKRNIPNMDRPLYIKLMATTDGILINEYDR